MTTPDYSKLPPEMQQRLAEIEANSPQGKTTALLGDILRLLQGLGEREGLSFLVTKEGSQNYRTIVENLQSLQKGIQSLVDKPDQDTGEITTPILSALTELNKGLTKAIKSIDVRPEIKPTDVVVKAPEVNVDLKGVERAIKDIPKAFDVAIKKIPKTEVNVPETDLSTLEDAMQKMLEWLESIDSASRMKPLPASTMKVTNPDGSVIGSSGSGVAAFADSSDTDSKGLVDEDRHVQVDVLSTPTTTVQATNLDIRDLTFASDTVDASGSTLGSNSGVDIGDVTVNNTTGAPVYTQSNITGIAHGVKTVTTAGTDEALVASSTPCKKVTIQSQTDNTGFIAVGTSGVDATEATGTGILLNPGDAYEFEIDNLADVYIDATVNGEGVRYTYFS